MTTHKTDQDSMARQAVVNALLASGFPFQTAIAELAQQVTDCKVVTEEFPWRDDNGAGFLDLVVFKYDFIVAMECKKTQKEIFTFLQPAGAGEKVIRSRCLFLTQIYDQSMRLEMYCSDWEIKPNSLESMFCVVSTSDSGKDQRMLEKDAQLLIRGADAFARHFKQELKPKPAEEPDRVVVPLIVTNAKLFEAKYQPGNVSLETGQLPATAQPDISPIEWVRFRKTFTAGGDRGDRTVFVVAASSLQKFLDGLDKVSSPPFRGRVHVA